MTFWDQHGQEVEISQADQKWLDDAYFTAQQMRLPVDSLRAALSYRVSTKGQVDHDDILQQAIPDAPQSPTASSLLSEPAS